ncbi:gfo/Idh/MocA family oxidoreductase [Xylanibacillus composti]|uniref:Oxidoreductase n=1 Tax=Xylanibacillus composti TaxID=1572762 RepID=A0A8J4M201_9BACL|nr:Gfo/Idh/MocA family oxidoreductase [Xylanibacillus composti]MDT9723570.1 gfo/Idh/MocA family oxidoreductase [Xylanibacillus composti]GIQ68392.1 oxidoreductase [Xylanibacillus composti]
MAVEKIGVGMIGYKFMGKAHSHAYKDLSMFFPQAIHPQMLVICGRDETGVKQAQEQFGWQSCETDWRKVIANPDVGLIDINAPSNVHKEIAIEAARAGKHVFCEKPLALTLADAREMLREAQQAGIKHMVGFNYRFAPAVQLARKLIAEGRIGTIRHFRAQFLQDWLTDDQFPLVWRLQKEVAGSGSHGDLNAHLIDMAHFLVGGIEEVVGMSETFVKERPKPAAMSGLSAAGAAGGEKGEVTVDDATLFLARFANGALGSFEATRFAAGRRCANTFEINGSLGSLRFDFERMNELEVYFTSDEEDVQGFRRVLATDPAHAYAEAWWPPGHTLGYEHTLIHEVVELMEAISENRQPVPNFEDGVKCQQVLDAVELSVAERRWVKVQEL